MIWYDDFVITVPADALVSAGAKLSVDWGFRINLRSPNQVIQNERWNHKI